MSRASDTQAGRSSERYFVARIPNLNAKSSLFPQARVLERDSLIDSGGSRDSSKWEKQKGVVVQAWLRWWL